jgi:tetratricopeptide (TPR) repeat protein
MSASGKRGEPGSGGVYRHRRFSRKLPLGLVLFIITPLSIALAQISHVEQAASLLNQGQLDQAESEAHKAMADPASRPLALAMMGTIRLQQGRYQESENFLTQALALNPKLPGARMSLATAYVLEGKLELARKNFEKVLALDAGNFNARFSLAKVDSALHNFHESLDLITPSADKLKGSEDGLLLLATDYGALGKKEKLATLVPAWAQLSSPSSESSLEFADILTAAGLKTEAQDILKIEEAKLVSSPSSPLAFNIGKSYMALGKLDQAESNLQLALTLNPSCAPCNQSLAEIAEHQGDSEKALAYLIAAKKLDPNNPEILFEFGKVCLERNLLDDALPALARAVDLKPDQDQYVYLLGSASVAKHDLPKAASLFGQLLKKRPHDAVLNYAMGTVYYLQDKYPEAESSLKESLRANPGQVAAPYYLGLTYAAQGQDDQAAELFRDLLKSYPDHAPSYVKLGSILLRQHQYEEAQRDLERAVALDPNSVEAHYQLGLLLKRMGKPTESDEQFAESRKLESERRQQTDMHLRLLLPD